MAYLQLQGRSYTSMEINTFTSESQENCNKINRDGYFWEGQLYALQTTWFIALGRLFDRRGYSVHRFLVPTVAQKGLFTKAALGKRKRTAAQEDNPEWLDQYLKTAWEPTTQDLQNIAASIGTAEARWRRAYKPIRNKVFAHQDLSVSVGELFGQTRVADIENILHDLNRIQIAIYQLLENGQQQWIADDERTYIDQFIADTRNALSRL